MFYGADQAAIHHGGFGDRHLSGHDRAGEGERSEGVVPGWLASRPRAAPAVAVTAIGEALNYATDPRAGLEGLRGLATRVRGALAPGGVFLFDVAGPGRHGPDGVRFHDRDDWILVNRVEESADHSTLDRRITIFRTSGKSGDGAYRRTDEHHVLRLYEPATLIEVLRGAGFEAELLASYGSTTESTPIAGWTVVLARPAPWLRTG
jgi:hypothetical protein